MKRLKTKIIVGVIVAILVIAGVGAAAGFHFGQLNMKSKKSEDSSKQESSESDNKDQSADGDREISREEAEKIATDRYGGEVKETESDDYHGTPAWEVEIRHSEEGRIEVKVDKKTGKILDIEQN